MAALKRVEEVVGEHFPEALDPLKAALAVAAVACLKDNTQPTSLILIARSGAGKSLVIDFVTPDHDDDPLTPYFDRADNFTPASLVSHRADRSEDELKEIDMLPRIKGKTTLVREMAPWFSGKRDELVQKFAILTAVLDGKGYVSYSGAHGKRGYPEPINFQLLGGTTPLSPEVLEIMGQLGPRLLFYDADRPRKSVDQLADYAAKKDRQKALEECRVVVREFLDHLFLLHPPGTILSDGIAVSKLQLRWLALWADVLARLRADSPKHGDDEVAPPEHAERVLGMLKHFALGSALAHGRTYLDDYDLAQVGHIALSSGVAGRGRMLRALLAKGGTATTPEIAELAGVSTPTALRYMEELAAVGLANFTEGKGTTPATVALVEPFTELCSAPLLKAKWGEGEG